VFLALAVTLILSLVISFVRDKTPTILGIGMFVVLSPSMEDTIMEGDMIFMDTSYDALEEGDIIAFERPDRPDIIITHRIVSIDETDDGYIITTKGDNNDASLGFETGFSEEHVIGKYIGRSAFMGFLYTLFFQNRFGLIFGALVFVFVILMVMEIHHLIGLMDEKSKRERDEEKEKLIKEAYERLKEQEDEQTEND
jgi:signal peptidase